MLVEYSYDKIQGERPLFHVLKQNRRREARTVTSIQDPLGTVLTNTSDICVTFASYFRQTYAPIISDYGCTAHLAHVIWPADPPTYAAHLECPITAEEL
jgi:hypothetical protein